MSETCCARLAENTARKKSPKSRHLGTIAQSLSGYIFATKACIDNRKKTCLAAISPPRPHDMLNFGPLAAEMLASLGHSCKFQRISRLGSVTARHSSIGRQPNFAALNKGRHLYLAGRPSRWALAHILVWACIQI